MILLFSDGSQSSNFMGIVHLSRSYQNDKTHRGQYLSAMWETAGEGNGGGLLKEFEISCMGENTLAREYKAAGSASPGTSENFLEKPQLERLEFLCASPPCRTLMEHDHQGILEKNREFFEDLFQYTKWDHESVKTLRLLLLLLLQLKQADTARLESEEQAVLERAFRNCQLGSASCAVRIYPFQSGALFLREGKVYRKAFDLPNGQQPVTVSIGKEVLLDFALYAESQRVEVTVSGKLTSASASEVYRDWVSGGCPPLKMAACYGDLYLLLKEEGDILCNVEDICTSWKDAVWVGAGLNSVSAICGEKRQLYASIPVNDHTGVREALTFYDGFQSHYGALLEDDTLIVDGMPVGEASAAAICSVGVVFVSGKHMMLYRFGQKNLVQISECCGEIQALCIEDCTTFTPPRLNIIWMTEMEVSHRCFNV